MGRNGSNEWKTVQLGDVIELFDSQRVPLNSRQRQERPGQYPYYGAQGIIDHIDGYIFDGRYILVAEDGENLNSKKLPLALFANGKFWVNNHAHILRGKPDVADDTFLLACLNNADIKPFVTGAAQPKLSQANLRRIEVSLPPLPVQQRIACILSAYDELMENSQRRIRLLEAMARALYREWFVHFRYPGHEKVPLVRPPSCPGGASPKPDGDIPQGWEGTFGDIALMDREGVNPSDFPDELFEHFSIPAFDDGRTPAVELGETILSNKYCIDSSCVLLSKLNPRIPRIWLPEPTGTRRAITSTEFLVLKPKTGFTREFIYAKCCSEEFVGQFTSLAIGTSTSHQRVKPENLLAIPSTVPDRKAVEQFTKLVAPLLAMSEQLRAKIQNLRRTRDLLLPRLLSGQVELETEAA